MPNIPEANAAAIFAMAIKQKRAAELLEALFRGDGVTIDPGPPISFIIIPASEIERVTKEAGL